MIKHTYHNAKIKLLRIKGHKIPIWEFGDPKNPLLVFIHGFPCPFSDFGEDTPFKFLKEKYHIIAFDMPEFGMSKSIKMEIIPFINAVIHRCTRRRRYALFGISFGGIIALKYAHAFPQEVKGVIVCGTPYFKWYPRKIIAFFAWLCQFINARFHRILNHFLFLDYTNLSKIHIPVLLLYSSKDRVANLWMGKMLRTVLPHTKIIAAHDRGHMCLLDKFEKCTFMDGMLHFLNTFSINERS